MRKGWRIGRIAGVNVFVDPSWGIIAVLLVFSQWAAFGDPANFPGLSGTAATLLAVLTTVLFFGSVLAHELAHAVTSKARHIPVRGITLYLFGGATHSERPTATPLDEFLVTVVGPVTNLLIGGALLAVHVWALGLARPIRVGMVGFLAAENLFLGAFNLLPGFPLDGGRVLRAVIWRLTGDERRATRASARGGQIVALLVFAGGVAWGAAVDNFFLAGWAFLIGWFILQGASAALHEERNRGAIRSARVRDVMAPPPPVIEASMPLSLATERFLANHDGEAFPVTSGERVIGFVSLRTARATPAAMTVADATVDGRGVVEAAPGDAMTDLLARAAEDGGATTVLVMEEGKLVGVIEPEDLRLFLRRGQAPGPPPSVPPPPIPPPPPPSWPRTPGPERRSS
jgi:Zn-dependent protease/CBS domain-containing protein